MSLKINLGLPEFFLKMGNPSAREVYEFDDFRLDAGHRMLYYREEEIALAPKAVETLLALVERRGNIVSKDELLEAVWPDAVVEESNLFLYLSVLRRTLGTRKDGKPWVETLRRRGYRFSGDVRLALPTNGANGASNLKYSSTDLDSATSDSPPPEPVLIPTPDPINYRRRILLMGIGLVVVLAAVTFAYQYFGNRSIDSIAVMPFVNETGDSELEYIADGMTEDLIGGLSKIPHLNVQSRTSVFRYKGKETDPRSLGKELGVDAVLYSRLTKRGEYLSLKTELVDSQTGARLWESDSTEKMADLIGLERKIHRDLVTQLGFERSGALERETSSKQSIDNVAYDLSLKGRFYSLKLTPTEIWKGIDYFNQAVEKDPTYAKAYAGIARAHLILGIAGEEPPGEFIEAKNAAEKAIELEPTLAEGYSALAGVAFFYGRNFSAAEDLYKRALELDPESSTAHQQYADFLNKTGRREEGKAEIARAMQLESSSVFINAFYAASLPNQQALDQIRFAIDMGPDNYLVHLVAGDIYRRNEMYEQAVAELRRAKELSPQQTLSDVGLIGVLMRLGRSDEARTIADQLFSEAKKRYVPPPHLALVCKHLGDRDKAFDYLEEGYRMHDPKMVFLNEAPWNDYRDDPQFQDLKRRVGFSP